MKLIKRRKGTAYASEEYFTQEEAEREVNRQVKTVIELPCVARGTVGEVVAAKHHGGGKWVVRIQWPVIKPSYYSNITLHLVRTFLFRPRGVIREYTKSEYEKITDK